MTALGEWFGSVERTGSLLVGGFTKAKRRWWTMSKLPMIWRETRERTGMTLMDRQGANPSMMDLIFGRSSGLVTDIGVSHLILQSCIPLSSRTHRDCCYGSTLPPYLVDKPQQLVLELQQFVSFQCNKLERERAVQYLQFLGAVALAEQGSPILFDTFFFFDAPLFE
jgi:hypothetical protein